MANMPIAPIENYPRNTRFRGPMSSYQWKDLMDEIYWELVELIGFQNSAGAVAPSGAIVAQGDAISVDGEIQHTFAVDDVSTSIPMYGAQGVIEDTVIGAFDITENVTTIIQNRLSYFQNLLVTTTQRYGT